MTRPVQARGPQGAVAPGPVDAALRAVLTASGLARSALARRLGMGVRDVEAMEHVMLAAAPPELTGRPSEPLGPVELSRRLGVSSAAGTQALQRLERQGHLSAVPHPHDGRRRLLQASEAGRDHVLSQLGPMLTALGEVSGRLSEADQLTVERYLREVAEVLDGFAAAPDDRAGQDPPDRRPAP